MIYLRGNAMPSRYQIAFYVCQDGCCPVEDYMFDGRNITELSILVNVLQRLAMVGQKIIDTEMAKHISGPIFELRKDFHRIMYAEDKRINGFVILSAFWKETPKTPPQEIEKAFKYLQDYRDHQRVQFLEIPLDENLINL